LPIRPAVFDRNVLAINIADIKNPVETPPPDARLISAIYRSGFRSSASPAVAPVRQAAKQLLSQQAF
jgi:hypothetical protein